MKHKGIKKSGLLILALVFSGFFLTAQNPSYSQLISIISSKFPDTNVSQKVIALSVWSSANAQSRATNKELDRVGSIYQGAKLKNGVRGAIVISCNMDDPSAATIAANKDGITYAIRVNKADFSFLNNLAVNSNVVYDATGAKVYENLAAADVFISFNHLVTR